MKENKLLGIIILEAKYHGLSFLINKASTGNSWDTTCLLNYFWVLMRSGSTRCSLNNLKTASCCFSSSSFDIGSFCFLDKSDFNFSWGTFFDSSKTDFIFMSLSENRRQLVSQIKLGFRWEFLKTWDASTFVFVYFFIILDNILFLSFDYNKFYWTTDIGS